MTACGSLEPGALIAGRYRVEAVIGGGAHGVVHRATDELLGRRVAIKHGGPDATEAFVAEARALASIDPRYVAVVHDLVMHHGEPLLILQYVEGVSLWRYLRDRIVAGQPVTVAEGLDLLLAIAESVAAVHRAGYVHGDLSARNLMVTAGGRVTLVDFGLATHRELGSTRRGGSPDYMAPEVVTGQLAGDGLVAVDLYAVGALGWEIMTGGVPFAGSDPRATALMHVLQPVPAAPAHRELPRPIERLLRALLAKRPVERPATAELLLWQLRAIRLQLAGAVRRDRFHVAVVEDDPIMLAVLAATVADALPDAEVATAATGADAFSAIRDRSPDLVVLDLSLPDTDGLTLCTALRAGEWVSPACAFVAVSATSDPGIRQALGALGVTSFVPKSPALPRELAGVLRALRSSLEHAPPLAAEADESGAHLTIDDTLGAR